MTRRWSASCLPRPLRLPRHPAPGARGYGTERLEAACQRGMDIGARTYGSVQSILRNGLDRAYRPEPVPDELPVQHENIPGSGYSH